MDNIPVVYIWIFLLPSADIIVALLIVKYLDLYDYISGESITNEVPFGDWANKFWYIHTMEYYSAAKMMILCMQVLHAHNKMGRSQRHYVKRNWAQNSTYCSKKKQGTDTCCNLDDPWKFYAHLKKWGRKDHSIVWFHLYEISSIALCIETGGGLGSLVVVRG